MQGTSLVPYLVQILSERHSLLERLLQGNRLDRLQNRSAQQQCDSFCPGVFLKLPRECP